MANGSKKELNREIKEDSQTECMVKLKGPDLATYTLYQAIENNDLDQAAQAIKDGANVNSKGMPCAEQEDTPLETAAFWSNTYNCSMQMIELLKLAGAYLYDKEKVKFIENAEKCLLDKTINKKKFRT